MSTSAHASRPPRAVTGRQRDMGDAHLLLRPVTAAAAGRSPTPARPRQSPYASPRRVDQSPGRGLPPAPARRVGAVRCPEQAVNPRQPTSNTARVPRPSRSRVTQRQQHSASSPRHDQGGLRHRQRRCKMIEGAAEQVRRRHRRWPPPRLCRRVTPSAHCVTPSATWRMPVRDQAAPVVMPRRN